MHHCYKAKVKLPRGLLIGEIPTNKPHSRHKLQLLNYELSVTIGVSTALG